MVIVQKKMSTTSKSRSLVFQTLFSNLITPTCADNDALKTLQRIQSLSADERNDIHTLLILPQLAIAQSCQDKCTFRIGILKVFQTYAKTLKRVLGQYRISRKFLLSWVRATYVSSDETTVEQHLHRVRADRVLLKNFHSSWWQTAVGCLVRLGACGGAYDDYDDDQPDNEGAQLLSVGVNCTHWLLLERPIYVNVVIFGSLQYLRTLTNLKTNASLKNRTDLCDMAMLNTYQTIHSVLNELINDPDAVEWQATRPKWIDKTLIETPLARPKFAGANMTICRTVDLINVIMTRFSRLFDDVHNVNNKRRENNVDDAEDDLDVNAYLDMFRAVSHLVYKVVVRLSL